MLDDNKDTEWHGVVLVHVVAIVIVVVIIGQLRVSVLLELLKPVGLLRLLVVFVFASSHTRSTLSLSMSGNKVFKGDFSSHGLTGVVRRPVTRKVVRDFPGV